MKVKIRNGIRRDLLLLSVLPALGLGIIIISLSSYYVYRTIENEVMKGLKGVVTGLYGSYAGLEGEFYLDKEGNIYKGTTPLKKDDFYVKNIKINTQYDATLFAGALRVLTTVERKDGSNAIGTYAAPEVTRTVLEDGRDYFSDNVTVAGRSYFGYYMPIKGNGGSAVGMLFVGTPRQEVMRVIKASVLRYTMAAVCILAAVSIYCTRYSKRIVENLQSIMEFMKKSAEGDIKVKLDHNLLLRKDEIGEMGRASIILQDCLMEKISTDPLTGLLNRRSASINMMHEFEHGKRERPVLGIAMGDIDYFKTINDAYGHDCGDLILKELSLLFKEFMKRKGFVARWGGEEFLFVFTDVTQNQLREFLENLLSSIRIRNFCYEGNQILVTMTFGITIVDWGKSIEMNIKDADNHLYEGKQNGRDQVIG